MLTPLFSNVAHHQILSVTFPERTSKLSFSICTVLLSSLGGFPGSKPPEWSSKNINQIMSLPHSMPSVSSHRTQNKIQTLGPGLQGSMVLVPTHLSCWDILVPALYMTWLHFCLCHLTSQNIGFKKAMCLSVMLTTTPATQEQCLRVTGAQ